MTNQSLPIPFRERGAPPNTPPLLLFFEETAVKNVKASENGPPVFDRAHFVRVVVAGSNNDGPIYEIARYLPDGTEKVDKAAYARFGVPYEEWKKGQAPSDAGTPLEQWPLMDVAMVATLKASNVYTVQQLADLSDAQCESALRRGGREWRAKAKAWLSEAKDAAQAAHLTAELAKRDEQIADLQKQVKELMKKQNGLGFDKPRARKRRDDDMDVVVPDEPEGERL